MSTIYLFHLFPHSRYIHRHNNTKLTYHPPSLFPLTTPIPPPTLQVFNNPSLQTLCAPNLEDGGDVCIGDESNQPSLDADLSSLVTGSFTGFSDDCYGGIDPPTNQLNATTVCGVVPDGLFTTAGCSVTSKACKNTKKTKKGKKNKP